MGTCKFCKTQIEDGNFFTANCCINCIGKHEREESIKEDARDMREEMNRKEKYYEE